MNISVYSPLSGSTFIKLSCTLIYSMKGLINSKNNDSKCFLRCHIIHLNPLKTHPERIAKADKKMANDLDYEDVEFPVSKKYFSKIEKIIFSLMRFVMRVVWFILFLYQIRSLKIVWTCC